MAQERGGLRLPSRCLQQVLSWLHPFRDVLGAGAAVSVTWRDAIYERALWNPWTLSERVQAQQELPLLLARVAPALVPGEAALLARLQRCGLRHVQGCGRAAFAAALAQLFCPLPGVESPAPALQTLRRLLRPPRTVVSVHSLGQDLACPECGARGCWSWRELELGGAAEAARVGHKPGSGAERRVRLACMACAPPRAPEAKALVEVNSGGAVVWTVGATKATVPLGDARGFAVELSNCRLQAAFRGQAVPTLALHGGDGGRGLQEGSGGGAEAMALARAGAGSSDNRGGGRSNCTGGCAGGCAGRGASGSAGGADNDGGGGAQREATHCFGWSIRTRFCNTPGGICALVHNPDPEYDTRFASPSRGVGTDVSTGCGGWCDSCLRFDAPCGVCGARDSCQLCRKHCVLCGQVVCSAGPGQRGCGSYCTSEHCGCAPVSAEGIRAIPDDVHCKACLLTGGLGNEGCYHCRNERQYGAMCISNRLGAAQEVQWRAALRALLFAGEASVGVVNPRLGEGGGQTTYMHLENVFCKVEAEEAGCAAAGRADAERFLQPVCAVLACIRADLPAHGSPHGRFLRSTLDKICDMAATHFDIDTDHFRQMVAVAQRPAVASPPARLFETHVGDVFVPCASCAAKHGEQPVLPALEVHWELLVARACYRCLPGFRAKISGTND
eukprot:g1771.t1